MKTAYFEKICIKHFLGRLQWWTNLDNSCGIECWVEIKLVASSRYLLTLVYLRRIESQVSRKYLCKEEHPEKWVYQITLYSFFLTMEMHFLKDSWEKLFKYTHIHYWKETIEICYKPLEFVALIFST